MSDEDFIKSREGMGPEAEYRNKATEIAFGIFLMLLISIGITAFIIEHPNLIRNFFS